MANKSDAELARKISRGNREAFGAIYDRYHRQLFFLAMRYLKEQQLAEDALQNLFIKLWKNRKKLDPSRSIKSFLFTMLKNHLLNTIRNRKRAILSEYIQLNESRHPHSNTADNNLIYSEYQEILQQGLSELSQGQREVFNLKVFKGLSNAQVADSRSVSINTVKAQFYQGCKIIKSYLKKHANISS